LAGTPEAAKKLAELKSKDDTYDKEKEEIKNKAEDLQKEAAANSAINDKCDLSALLLQIAVVIASVAILTSWRAMWYAGLALGVAGTIAGVLAYL
jgi:hypothetical protein